MQAMLDATLLRVALRKKLRDCVHSKQVHAEAARTKLRVTPDRSTVDVIAFGAIKSMDAHTGSAHSYFIRAES